MKTMILLFAICLIAISAYCEEISTTFICPNEPLVRITFNIPENVDGEVKYIPMHIKLTGEAITSSGAKMPISIEKNSGDLQSEKLTPSQIYALIKNEDIQLAFAEYYDTACGMNVTE